ncbi:hypothetical protein [Photobacterium galatheae]|uniref:Uncharacterized protein n=1 Tax=Photobacterium galatheae TaxID=1654360 RepID=A0A066RUH4_9GAMM|nr:hypothetical protein [Photobacterium galatheae]KDM91038.1 hypothetical protein EA58_14920 [Photobacterium galatheae]MCM0149010.1 hypothetical protein [Photobacterium galatheae]
MFRINSDLYVSDCGTKYAIKHSERQWDVGEVVSLRLVKDQSSASNALFKEGIPVYFVYFSDFCLGYQLILDEDRLRISNAIAKKWLKPRRYHELERKISKALHDRTAELDQLDKEYGLIEINALSNKLTVRQLLALLSAKEVGCKLFEQNHRGWSISIPENVKLKSSALDYRLHDHDIEHMKSQGFLEPKETHVYSIVKYPQISPPFDLSKALYAQQK